MAGRRLAQIRVPWESGLGCTSNPYHFRHNKKTLILVSKSNSEKVTRNSSGKSHDKYRRSDGEKKSRNRSPGKIQAEFSSQKFRRIEGFLNN